MFDKYVVFVGGGKNYRYFLFDVVLIKDNYIKVVGSIIEVVKRVKENVLYIMKVEVEVCNM